VTHTGPSSVCDTEEPVPDFRFAIPVAIPEMEEGQEVLEREQRREKQELQDKVMVIKNGVPKGDKKKKKEANAKIAKLEGDLNEKHSAELMDLLLNAVSISDEAEAAPVENGNEDEKDAEEAGGKAGEPRVSKAQKRREKKAEKEEQRRREIEEQEEVCLIYLPQILFVG
jgi:OTU domain-containing protein 6